MEITRKFSDEQLMGIIDEATIYMCACPAQVAHKIRSLRELVQYQNNCAQKPEAQNEVHAAISKAAIAAHVIMEDCMDEVLTLEGWDRETLKMPEGLRKRRDQEVHQGK